MKYLFLFIALFYTNHITIACSCLPPGLPKTELKKSDLVCTGKIISIRKFDNYTNEFTILIIKYFKGKKRSKTLTVLSEINTGASCGYPFELGKEYIIFSSKEPFTKFIKDENGKTHRKIEKRYYTNSCKRTKLIEEDIEDLSYLNERKN